MTNATPVIDARVGKYLLELDTRLSGVAAEEKNDILREIRAHILDSLAGGATVEPVLAGLGTPKELAERYRMEAMLTRASQSFSPWVLLQTAWRWAFSGVKGMLVFLVGLFGYLTAVAMTISVILKPFMPWQVGLWIGPDTFILGVGTQPTEPGVHEVLGRAFIPVITVGAFLLAIGTTQLLRRLIRLGAPKLGRNAA